VRSVSPSEDISGRAPERRNHHRVLVGADAWLIIDDERFSAECVDLSMGGAAVITDAHLATGAVTRLEFSPGMDRGAVSIQCEVVRRAGTQVGLRFLALDSVSLEAILSLL
jgi:c-di-GMP-binding flagellar brake protein YcgR